MCIIHFLHYTFFFFKIHKLDFRAQCLVHDFLAVLQPSRLWLFKPHLKLKLGNMSNS